MVVATPVGAVALITLAASVEQDAKTRQLDTELRKSVSGRFLSVRPECFGLIAEILAKVTQRSQVALRPSARMARKK